MSSLSKVKEQIIGFGLKKKANEFELTAPLIDQFTDKPLRLIIRHPTKDSKGSATDGRNINDACQISGDSSEQNRGGSTNAATTELEESHPRFGPLYGVDHPSVYNYKEKTWDRVLKSSSKSEPSEEQESLTMEIYFKEMRRVEKEAKGVYAEKGLTDTGPVFRWMMIKDGCFFLQAALAILGYSENLGYPTNDPVFRKKPDKAIVKKWIEAMFFVGNQIPLVVINELIKQDYFQNVIQKVRDNRTPPPSGLCGKVLYDLVVVPALNKLPNSGLSLKERLTLGKLGKVVDQQYSCDLLHGLQNILIGPTPRGHDHFGDQYEADDDIDLEANEDDYYEDTIDHENEDGGENADRIIIRRLVKSITNDKRQRIFPCAAELKREGINIKKLKNGAGSRSIKFNNYYLRAYLHLPVFPVDENVEVIFRNLLIYESCHQKRRTKREASAYLRFMSDIIQTTKDVKLLQKKGIVQGNSDYAEKLPGILSRLVSSHEDIRLTRELHVLRRKISDYSSPWIHYKILANLVVLLAVLQTFFAVLAYFRPPK